MADDKAAREIEDTREAIATVKVKVKKENQAAAIAAHEAAKAAEADYALVAAAALAEDEECMSPKSVLSSNRYQRWYDDDCDDDGARLVPFIFPARVKFVHK